MGVVAGVAGAASVVGGVKAGKAAKKSSREDAARIRMETDEALKRTERSQEQSLSTTRAGMGASGIRSGAGTTKDYLEEMQKTFQEDLEWIEKSGASQESLARAQGNYAQKAARASAWGSAASTASGIGDFWK